jgi:hypothetical protein
MSADLLEAWNRLDVKAREACECAIAALVAAKLKADTPGWYPGAMQNEPNVVVYAARGDGRQLTVHFVADHLMYCYAQSGSDWADHYIFTGEATFEGTTCTRSSFALVEDVFLHELETDDYDQRAIAASVRDAAVAKYRGVPADIDKTAELVRQMRDNTEARVEAHRAKLAAQKSRE